MKKMTTEQKKWAMTGGLLSALLFNISFLGQPITDYKSYSADLASSIDRAGEDSQPRVHSASFGDEKYSVTYISEGEVTKGVLTPITQGKVCATCDSKLVSVPVTFNGSNFADINRAIEEKYKFEKQEKTKEKIEPATESSVAKNEAAKKEEEKEEPKTKEELFLESMDKALASLDKRCKDDLVCKASGLESIVKKDKDRLGIAKIKAFWETKLKTELQAMIANVALANNADYLALGLGSGTGDRSATREALSTSMDVIHAFNNSVVGYDAKTAKAAIDYGAGLVAVVAKQAAAANQQAQQATERANAAKDLATKNEFSQQALGFRQNAIESINDLSAFRQSYLNGVRTDVVDWIDNGTIARPTGLMLFNGLSSKLFDNNSLGLTTSGGVVTLNNSSLSPLSPGVNATVSNFGINNGVLTMANGQQMNISTTASGIYAGLPVAVNPQFAAQRLADWKNAMQVNPAMQTLGSQNSQSLKPAGNNSLGTSAGNLQLLQ